MTTPIRRVCRGVADLPPPAEIMRLVDDDHHLVLRVDRPDGPDFDERLAIDRLDPQLPGYTVFDSGGGVTIKKVIAEQDVLAEADAIVAAAAQFRRTAAGLMNRLSRRLDIPLEASYGLECRPLLRRGWSRNRWKGRLDFRWGYGFHGHECGFRDRLTGQAVEAILGFPGEFGVLDPFFFARFVATTTGLERVAALSNDGFHDPLRAMEVLEREGRLMRISAQATGRRGLVATEACDDPVTSCHAEFRPGQTGQSRPQSGLWLWPPEGPPRRLPEGDRITLGALDRAGLWRVAGRDPATGEESDPPIRSFACDAGDDRESDLRGKPAPRTSAAGVEMARSSWAQPPWFYVVGVACCLTLLEWWLYQERLIS